MALALILHHAPKPVRKFSTMQSPYISRPLFSAKTAILLKNVGLSVQREKIAGKKVNENGEFDDVFKAHVLESYVTNQDDIIKGAFSRVFIK